MAHLVFTDQNFESEVLKSDKVVVVDFWAPWCMPCMMLGPIIEEIADEMGEKVKVGKLNVDENQGVATKYDVMSIPTVLILKGGEIVESFVGMQSKDVYVDAINKHAA
jgi:thioredoxin 1